MNAESIVPIAFFASILGIVYLSYRKKERMALIQSGRDASLLDHSDLGYGTLKWGLLLMGVGVGLLLAEIIVKLQIMSEGAAYFSMASIFGGVALILDFMIEKNRSKSSVKAPVDEPTE